MDDVPPIDMIDNPKGTTYDHLFCMFKECTYFFEPTEVRAYAREFSLYLDNYELDFNEILDDPRLMNMCGAGPLVWYNLLYNIPLVMNQYIEDDNHVDYDYIVRLLRYKTWEIKVGL